MIPVVSIAKKEFMEHTRRGGVVALAALFLLVTLSSGYMFAVAAEEVSGGLVQADLAAMIRFMQSSVGLLIPIIALLLAHGAVAGELESGSLALLLAQPVSRLDVAVGKFLGLFGVLAAAEVVGFGGAGAVIHWRLGAMDWGTYGLFMLGAVLFGAAYLGLFLLFSTLVRRRGVALTLSIVAWVVFGMMWDFLVAFFALQSGLESVARGTEIVLPWWFTVLMFLSPPDLFAWFLKGAIDVSTSLLVGAVTGSSVEGAGVLLNPWSVAAGLLAWVAVTVGVAWQVLERKDV